MAYISPTTRDQYWKNVNEYWDGIQHMLRLYLPTFQKRWINGEVLPISMDDHLIELRDARNPKLVRAFHAALWNAPDEHRGEWFHKDWNVLYDLCLSECFLIEEREE